MKPTAFFLNLARGEVVDEKGLLQALKESKLAGAGLDVREQEPPASTPFSGMENVILTPHIAAMTREAQERVVTAVCQDVAAVLAGGAAKNFVNFPKPKRATLKTQTKPSTKIMKLFIDTADVAQIKEAYSWGIVDGVTTNPTHAKTGRKPAEVYKEICSIVDGPISLETIGLAADEILKEGRELAKIHKNAVIKVVNTREGLKAVKQFTAEGIKTNVTVTFSPLQALLAAKVGAGYISPFVGRLDSIGHIGMDLVRQIRTIYDNYGYKTEISRPPSAIPCTFSKRAWPARRSAR